MCEDAAAGAAVRTGPVCWHSREAGHLHGQCTAMEVETLVRVRDVSQAAPDRVGTYRIPVRIQGGIYHTLVDLDSNQTSIHQSLVRGEAVEGARGVRVRWVHGDIHEYLVTIITVQLKGEKPSIKAVVSPPPRSSIDLGNKFAGLCSSIKGFVCGWERKKQGGGTAQL